MLNRGAINTGTCSWPTVCIVRITHSIRNREPAGGGFVLPAAHLIEMDGSRHQLPDKGAQFSSFKFRAGTPRNITTPVGSEWIARAICFIGLGL